MLDKSRVICEIKPSLLTSNGVKRGNVANSRHHLPACTASPPRHGELNLILLNGETVLIERKDLDPD